MKNLSETIKCAAGRIPAQTVFKNAYVLDVFSKKYRSCDIAVFDGIIVGVGKYSGETELDLTGKYIIPGLIDSHVHIESSCLTPRRYAEAVVPFGVTSVIADPHEIANVAGETGLEFMLESAKDLPLDIRYMMPSCVPATPFDNAGCIINGEDTLELMEKYSFLGLGEMMNYPGLLGCDEEVLRKLTASGVIDGHSPGLSGKELCAYAAAGITTDHECTAPKEAIERVSLGMYVHMRQGTLAANVAALAPAVTSDNSGRFTFCTDDKHIDEILEKGSVNHAIAAAVEAGISPELAVSMATINAAQCYGLGKTGALAPGYRADLVICEDKAAQRVTAVYKDGRKVAENGKPLFETKQSEALETVRDSVRIKPISEYRLAEPFDPAIPAIKVLPGSLYTEKVFADSDENLCFAAVIERHCGTGNVGRARLSGIDIRGGAVAQTIGHDSHNIIVAGDNEADMAAAVEALGKDGGIAVVRGGKTEAVMPLPAGGLMTDISPADAAAEYIKVSGAAGELCGLPGGQLLMTLAFLPLLVIPELKLSDRGLFDVCKFEPVGWQA